MTDQAPPEGRAPTPEEVAKSRQVAEAGAAAAAGAPEGQEQEQAKQAMRAEADRVQLEIDDDTINKIAEAVSAKNIQELMTRGAFDPPPERVQPPAQPAAPPAPGESEQPATAGQAQAEPTPRQPQKRTAAHRFFGL